MRYAAATSSNADRNHTPLPQCNVNIEQETGFAVGSKNQITSRKKDVFSFYRWRPQEGRY